MTPTKERTMELILDELEDATSLDTARELPDHVCALVKEGRRLLGTPRTTPYKEPLS
jgi:hypothetical protein